MKHTFLCLMGLAISSAILAQDVAEDKYELGTQLIQRRYSSMAYGIPDAPMNSYMSGLFFRTHCQNWGFRAQVSYQESFTESNLQPDCPDCYIGDAGNKALEAAAGVQYRLTTNKQFLYVFTDLGYRHVQAEGFVLGGSNSLNDTYTLTGNGLVSNLGLGMEITLWNKIRLSPEYSYHGTFQQATSNRLQVVTNAAHTDNLSSFNFTMQSRLLVTVPF